jgi:hypothetical protein
MCIRTDTIYKDRTCTILETECCPRCPEDGSEKCKVFKKGLEKKNGVCVGFLTLSFLLVVRRVTATRKLVLRWRALARRHDWGGGNMDGLRERRNTTYKAWRKSKKITWWS